MSRRKFSIYSRYSAFSKRLLLRFIFLMAVLLVVFAVLSGIMNRINLSSVSEQYMSNAGELISNLLDERLNTSAIHLEYVRQEPELENFIISLNTGRPSEDSKAAVKDALSLMKTKESDVVSVWVVSESSGMLLTDTGTLMTESEYGLKDKSWYKKYISGGLNSSYICTPPAQSIVSGDESVVTVILPVISEGNTYAFCGAELKAENLFSVLSQYTFNAGSYPVVTYDSAIIYSQNSEEFLKKFSFSEESMSNVISQSAPYLGAIDSYASEEKESVYYYKRKSAVSDWSTYVFFDNSFISIDTYKNYMQQLVILSCLAVLAVILGINILNIESSGLDEISACADELAAGNVHYRIENKTGTEIERISDSLNRIAEAMQAKNSVISNYDTTDILTGLQNRMRLYEHMEDIIRTRESGRSRFAVMFMDVDNFKWINETLGHTYGDAVLATFGGELKKLNYPIFRFSGDEFIIIKEFDTDTAEVYEVIEKLHSVFNKPLDIISDNIYIKFSIGVSIYPDDDTTPDLLLRDAEIALHRAKGSGKDRVAFYTNSKKGHNSPYSKAALAKSLPNALKNGELVLNFQPIISAKNYDIHGFEVLLRWNHPEFGVVPPAEFIDVAEESGDIVQIGTWIFESACRTLKQINESVNPNVIMSINVSPVQLKRDNYLEHIKRVIDITQVEPKNIQIEITESTLIDFIDSKSSVITEINDLGIAIALDDFGTGYSSLNYLKNFPIKCLKIDKSFIDEINNNQRDYAITDSIIDLVHSLGIHTVAEGIETVGQFDFLADMKCDYIQGFLMSKPLDEPEAIEFVEMYSALHKPDKHMLEENEKKLADEKKHIDDEKHKQESEGPDNEQGFVDEVIISK